MVQATLPAGRGRALEYDGRVGEIYGIFLLNLLWTVLTLGIFRFWAITRYRRYFWSRTRFQGERFEYTGTGGELFFGYLLAGLMLFGAAAIAGLAGFLLAAVARPLFSLAIVGFYLFVAVLAAGAIFSAQRYRLSRTRWCGIGGGMTGSMLAYGFRAVLYGLLTLVTLFQMVPWMQIRLTERRINASVFGTTPFRFAGSARQVYPAYLLTLLGTLVLLGVVGSTVWTVLRPTLSVLFSNDAAVDRQAVAAAMAGFTWIVMAAVIVFSVLSAVLRCWYLAVFERHVVGNTTLGTVRFASSMQGRALLGLVVGNLLIAVSTLGLGYPVILHRNARFLASTLWRDGEVEMAGLLQSTIAAPRFGEGLYQQLDTSGGML